MEEKSKSEPQEDIKAELLAALTPPPLPEAIANADQVQIDKAEKTLQDFGFNFPLKGMLDSFKSMHEQLSKQAAVLVQIAETNGKVNGFISNVEQAKAAQQKLLVERTEAEKQFLATHPEYQKQAEQKKQGGGFDIMSLIQQGAQLIGNQPANSGFSEALQTKMLSFFDKALDAAINPQPSVLEKLAEKVLLDSSAKKLAAAMS